MKLFTKAKDGGKESLVTGYWLFESKRFGSMVVLRFDEGSREAYHTHAFNAVSWVIRGCLREVLLGEEDAPIYMRPSIKPVFTGRDRFHRVFGEAPQTWVLSFRGPWIPQWKEWLPSLKRFVTLTHGRKVVDQQDTK